MQTLPATITIAQPSEAYLPDRTAARIAKRSCVSLGDLIEVLTSYYEGSLDQPKCILKMNLPLYEWSSNSLWNQIDSAQLQGMLHRLPAAERTSLHLYFNRSAQLQDLDPEDITESSLVLSVGQALDRLLQLFEEEL